MSGGSERDAASLRELTGGNPFYLSQVIAAGMDGHDEIPRVGPGRGAGPGRPAGQRHPRRCWTRLR